jgi:iron complex transport system substrate-binding protein
VHQIATNTCVRVLIASMLAATAAFALGCQESGFDERKETARPLKVQHVKGESKVPGQAERVITLSLGALDDTLALGVRPVRAAIPGLEPPRYLRGPAAGVEAIKPVTEEDMAALDAASPDLIVGRQGRLYDDLSLVAPTVITEPGGGRWKLNVRLVGEALGRTNDAEALLTDYDRRVAGVRRAVEGRPRVAVARHAGSGWEVAKRDSFAATILADAGFRQARSLDSADVVLASRAPQGLDGSFLRVEDALWWGPGGVHASRAALADLNRILQ